MEGVHKLRNFKAGDQVCLKSGGPTMTINSVLEDGGVQVVWHTDDGLLQREGLYTGALKRVSPKRKPTETA